MDSLTVATFRLSGAQQTGIGHYIDRLVRGLEARQDIAEVQVHEIRRRELEVGRLRVGGHVSRLLGLAVKRLRADVVHASHIPFVHARSTSAMIQDAVWADWPEEYSDTAFFVRRLKRRIQGLPLVMAPSHASARAVQEALALPTTPTVTLLAPDHDQFFAEDIEKGSYALYAGELRPRKHVAPQVVAAIEAGLNVIRCGPQKPRDMAESQRCHDIAQRCGGFYRDVGYVSRDMLRRLYAGAEVLMYASQEEGFGLPPFEAAACGTQSVLSPLPVFQELWPEGTAHFSHDGYSAAYQAAVDSPLPPARLIEHAKRYTWSRTVDAHVQEWRKVLDRAPPRPFYCESLSCEGCKWCLPVPGGSYYA